MTKRNAPCPCGSGKRFKHCHGKLVTDPDDPLGSLEQRRNEAVLRERRAQQGFGKAIQFHQMNDRIAVVIGRALMVGHWRTFTDFLLDYLAERMGRQWIAAEMQKGIDGHPIGQWASAMHEPQPAKPVGIIKAKINNAFRSILWAAYNVYAAADLKSKLNAEISMIWRRVRQLERLSTTHASHRHEVKRYAFDIP
jgi:hypothetical protein